MKFIKVSAVAYLARENLNALNEFLHCDFELKFGL